MTLKTYSHRAVKGEPRPAETYRAARRNAMKAMVWKGASDGGGPYRGMVRPNISRKRRA